MPLVFTVREARQADGAFLGDMVVEAANWRRGVSTRAWLSRRREWSAR